MNRIAVIYSLATGAIRMSAKVLRPAQFARNNMRAGEGCYIGRVAVDPTVDVIDTSTRKPRALSPEKRAERAARIQQQRDAARATFKGEASHRQRALIGALNAATPAEIEEIRRLLGVSDASR